jgi:hypothetical protein
VGRIGLPPSTIWSFKPQAPLLARRRCSEAVKGVITGDLDPERVNVLFAWRQNLTLRMSMRRLARSINTFSKRFENRCHALGLYFFFYNLRVHKTLDVDRAKAAGVIDRILADGRLRFRYRRQAGAASVLMKSDELRRPIPVAGFAAAAINSPEAEGRA